MPEAAGPGPVGSPAASPRAVRRPHTSLRVKLALPLSLLVGLIALFVSSYFPHAMEVRETSALRERGRSIAQVLAPGLRPALESGDIERLREDLRVAFGAAEVERVSVLDPRGRVLVREVRDRHEGEGRVGLEGLLDFSVSLRDGAGRGMGTLTVSVSRAPLLEDVAEFRRAARVAGLMIFVVGVVILLGVGHLVARPLFGIVQIAQRIVGGEVDLRVPVTTDDEVGRVADAFNLVLDQIQATQKELEKMNLDLEARVEERTHHWQRAVEEKSRIEEFYVQVLDTLPLQVAVFDPDKRYLYLNPSAAEDYPSREAMLGVAPRPSHLRSPVAESVMARRLDAISEAVESGCLVSIEERYGEGDEGRYFLRVFTPVLSDDGRVAKVVAYGVDITNRRQTEEALRVSEEKLRQSQKMEAVGRLAGGIAHDFNNLLTVITGHTELLLAEKADDDPDTEELRQMRRAAERASTLTRQLLAFSRRQVLQPQVLELNRVVDDVERMLSRLIGEHIDLVTVLSPETGRVRADPGQLEQVLMNLAVNARDAMPQGGTLTIETSALTHGEAAARWGDVVDTGRYALLSVKDSGIGIPESHHERIFEPFFTTKEVGKGTGLGLATVYGIVKQSDGFLFVDSKVGLGTVFRIYLPEAVRVLPAGTRWVDESQEGAVRLGETILLVEDEPLVRDLAFRVLQGAGYKVLVASGGHEALGVLRNREVAPDLLLTDVVMPGLAGNELAERARKILPDLPVLYMSGYTDETLLDRGALDEGIVLMQKPFTPERLLQVVRRGLDRDGSVAATAG